LLTHLFTNLLGSHTYGVRAFYFGRRVCRLRLSVPRQISKTSEIGAKFRHLYWKSGSPSKNMMSHLHRK